MQNKKIEQSFVNQSSANAKQSANYLKQLYRRSSLFRWRLKPTFQTDINRFIPPSDPWRGSATIGRDVLHSAMPVKRDQPEYFTFEWLRHVRDYGGDKARIYVRNEISLWLSENTNWDAKIWHPKFLSERISNLIFSYKWYASSASASFQNRLLYQLAIEFQCLALDWQNQPNIDDQISALRGLLVTLSAFNAKISEMVSLIDIFEKKLTEILNEDGGHISRRPETHFKILTQLFECRTAIAQSGIGQIKSLDQTITRMGAIAKMWRTGNGNFAHFHGGGITDSERIDDVVKRCGPTGKVTRHAKQTGFLRLSSGRTTLIMDCSAPISPIPENSASLGSFEVHLAGTPFIVNVGQLSEDRLLNEAFSQTAAHTALTLDNLNNFCWKNKKYNPVKVLQIGPATGGMLVKLSHDGYGESHGIIHDRQIYLTTGGGNLRGSDTLRYTGAPGKIPKTCIVRFHLHPRIRAATVSNGTVVLKISSQKAGWIFKCNGANPVLEPSVYFEGKQRLSSQQVVLRMHAHDIRHVSEKTLKWSFKRQ